MLTEFRAFAYDELSVPNEDVGLHMIEKRAHTRFQPSDGSGSILHAGNIGRIHNISMGGFKCCCLNGSKDEILASVCEIFQNNMLLGEHRTFSINVLNSCYILGHPFSVVPEKQCRVQFLSLNDRQSTFVADYIMNHCIF